MYRILCIAAVLLGAACAHAGTVFELNTHRQGQDRSAGTIGAIDALFDSTSKAFTWNVVFSDGVSKNTNGYTLVVSDGASPLGIRRQLAVIYFDARDMANPSVSVYRYNGANATSSFLDPADLLASNRGINAFGITAAATQLGNARAFMLTFNATDIDSMYNAGNGFPQWEGVRFASQIGVWFHPVANLDSAYSRRQLLKFNGTFGALDADHLQTTIHSIPAPASATLLLGLGAISARRRR